MRLHVYGEEPPTASSDWEYETPKAPSGSGDEEITDRATGFTAKVMVAAFALKALQLMPEYVPSHHRASGMVKFEKAFW